MQELISARVGWAGVLDRVLAAKRAETAALEAEIDRLVYALYGLTEDEIKLVEESVKR